MNNNYLEQYRTERKINKINKLEQQIQELENELPKAKQRFNYARKNQDKKIKKLQEKYDQDSIEYFMGKANIENDTDSKRSRIWFIKHKIDDLKQQVENLKKPQSAKQKELINTLTEDLINHLGGDYKTKQSGWTIKDNSSEKGRGRKILSTPILARDETHEDADPHHQAYKDYDEIIALGQDNILEFYDTIDQTRNTTSQKLVNTLNTKENTDHNTKKIKTRTNPNTTKKPKNHKIIFGKIKDPEEKKLIEQKRSITEPKHKIILKKTNRKNTNPSEKQIISWHKKDKKFRKSTHAKNSKRKTHYRRWQHIKIEPTNRGKKKKKTA